MFTIFENLKLKKITYIKLGEIRTRKSLSSISATSLKSFGNIIVRIIATRFFIALLKISKH